MAQFICLMQAWHDGYDEVSRSDFAFDDTKSTNPTHPKWACSGQIHKLITYRGQVHRDALNYKVM